MLKEAMPALRRVALLASRDDPATSSIVGAARNAARSLGVEVEMRSVESIDNLEGALTAVVKAGSSLKTAKAFGLTIAPALLARADEVIE